MTTAEMEIALSSYFDYRVNLIVPNVHWGMDIHECDLLMVSRHGYCTEIEIKVTKADLKADAKKRHGHRSNKIKYLYFALPDYLENAAEFVPARAGIILIRPSMSSADPAYVRRPQCRTLRPAVVNKGAQKMTDRDQYKVARLGALRIWSLKRKLL